MTHWIKRPHDQSAKQFGAWAGALLRWRVSGVSAPAPLVPVVSTHWRQEVATSTCTTQYTAQWEWGGPYGRGMDRSHHQPSWYLIFSEYGTQPCTMNIAIIRYSLHKVWSQLVSYPLIHRPTFLVRYLDTLCKIVLSKPKPYIFYSNLNLCPSETVHLSVKHDEEDQSGGATQVAGVQIKT